jgi:phosphatidylserine/phosphatidylglycerophosphate/cardiolipin synthase-like enzyme
MDLLVQPESGITPLITAIKKARTRIEIVIFRSNLKELQKALEAAVERGVAVHALIAHTNRGGEKRLRKLEQALLAAGVTVSRTGDDLLRYHGKMMVVDQKTLFVLGFNFTDLDAFKSRSFGIVSKQRKLVQEAGRLFEADTLRQAYVSALDTFVVSPESSRARLAAFLKGARKELCIYDPKIADGMMTRLLQDRARAGVKIRVLGKMTSEREGILVEKLPKLRLHVRAILRDDQQLFVGSQSLRPVELDRRREIGVVVRDAKIIKQYRAVFDADWALTDVAAKEARDAKDAKAAEKDERAAADGAKSAGDHEEKDGAKEPALAAK